MTVESTTRREQYATNGTTGPFTVGFYFLADEDIEVIHTDSDGLETTLALTTDYSVTGAGDPNGGAVTTTTAYPSGGFVTVLRNIDPLQETDYTETDGFPADSHERALDKATMLIQQLLEVTDRALVFSPSDEEGSQLPSAIVRASKLLGFDSLGRVSLNTPDDQSAASLALLLASLANQTEGAGMIGYNPALPYAAGTVGEALARAKVLPDFGAVGDGVTDDAAAIQSALTSYAGRVIDGLGRTYKVGSVLTGLASGTTLRNMTLDFSGIATTSAKYIYATGSKSTGQALTANLAIDAVTVFVASTSTFAAERWAWLESTSVWSTADGTTFGQYVKVKSVDSPTQLTLYAGPLMAFNTANAATISNVDPVVGLKFQNVKIIGSGANSQTGIYIFYGLDCVVENTCTITDVDYTGVVLARSINCKAAPTVLRARAAGLSYGIAMSQGSLGCATDGGYGEDVRHYVTVGDNKGVNINCRATNNVVSYARSAGIDSHVASINFIAERNQITLATGAAAEGITLQGLNGQAIGNTIRGVTGAGILMQPLVTATGFKNKGVAQGNHVYLANGALSSQVGIYFQSTLTNGGDWEGGDMDGNSVYGGVGSTGAIHFYVLANNTSALMSNITIRGNTSVEAATGQSLYIRALGANSTIAGTIIDSNHFNTVGLRSVYVLAEGAGTTITNTMLTSNIIKGGTSACVQITGTAGTISHFLEDNTIYTAGGGDLFAYSGTVTDLRLQTARRSTPSIITTATGASVPYTDTYIFNYAGTVTFTLESAATFVGREVMVRTIQAQAVNSASSDVVPRTSATPGTAILPATLGAWVILKSDGTNWQAVAGA